MECYELIGYIIVIVAAYKLLDWVIRRPYIGKYSERYILVTGCDTGFGNRLSVRLDALGCHVFAGCLTEQGGNTLKALCSERLKVVPLDVTNSDSVRHAFGVVKSALPPGKGLWGVMNNAGIMSALGNADWFCVDDYKSVCAVNLYGVIDVTAIFLPLVKLERGRVVNTASILGRHSLARATPYCVSKYGVEAFTDSLRRSLYALNMKAILIEPGFHKTNITDHSTLSPLVDKAWAQTTPEIREEYGEEYYKYVKEAGMKLFEDMCSARIDDVVDAYEHALLGLFPRARYMPGKDAKFIWMPIQWLPEWIGDLALHKYDPNQPLPACVKKKDA